MVAGVIASLEQNPMPQFDCHAHVYERVYTAVDNQRYLPTAIAPGKEWLAHHAANGVEGGVIVQISFFGTDNSELLTALRTYGTERYRGIAVVPFEMGEEEMLALKDEGIRGVRWNLVKGAPLPDLTHSSVRDFLKRLNRAGLHLQIQLEGPLLGPYLHGLYPPRGAHCRRSFRSAGLPFPQGRTVDRRSLRACSVVGSMGEILRALSKSGRCAALCRCDPWHHRTEACGLGERLAVDQP